MLRRLLAVVAFAVIVSINAAAILLAANHCDYTDKTAPKKLTSSNGTDAGLFYFETLSDVDSSDGLYIYTRIVRNLHKQAFLQFKWQDANVGLTELAPTRCFHNSYDSHFVPDNGNPTTIAFGNGLQDKNEKTPIYKETDKLPAAWF